MKFTGISIWGDSIAKGVIYDEERGRYSILKQNCAAMLSKETGIPVRNHSVMGMTARRCLDSLKDEHMIAGDIAVIEFGGNDSDMHWDEVAQAPDMEHEALSELGEYKLALIKLVERFREAGMCPVIVSPLPIDAVRYCKWASRDLDADAILRYLGDDNQMYRWQERYAYAARDVAYETGARLLDVRTRFLESRRFTTLFCVDGIHLNADGHKMMYDWFLPYLQ